MPVLDQADNTDRFDPQQPDRHQRISRRLSWRARRRGRFVQVSSMSYEKVPPDGAQCIPRNDVISFDFFMTSYLGMLPLQQVMLKLQQAAGIIYLFI